MGRTTPNTGKRGPTPREKSPGSKKLKKAAEKKAPEPSKEEKAISNLVQAFETEYKYDFPCRDLLAIMIPTCLGRCVEDRLHPIHTGSVVMIKEAIDEALSILRAKSTVLKTTFDGAGAIQEGFEKEIARCVEELERLAVTIPELEATEAKAEAERVAALTKFNDEVEKVQGDEDKYKSYLDDRELLEKTLEQWKAAETEPPTEGVKKHLQNLTSVLKRFFPSEECLITAFPKALYKAPDTRSAFDKSTIDYGSSSFTEKIEEYQEKINTEEPNRAPKEAAEVALDLCTERKDELTSELRENRRLKRETDKTRKTYETKLEDHPSDVLAWEFDYNEVEATIEIFNTDVMESYNHLASRTLLPPEPVSPPVVAPAEIPVIEVPVEEVKEEAPAKETTVEPDVEMVDVPFEPTVETVPYAPLETVVEEPGEEDLPMLIPVPEITITEPVMAPVEAIQTEQIPPVAEVAPEADGMPTYTAKQIVDIPPPMASPDSFFSFPSEMQ